MPGRRTRTNPDQLYQRLKLKSLLSEARLKKRHPAAAKFFASVGLRPGRIREHATKLLASGVLAGTLLLSAHSAVSPPIPPAGTDSVRAALIPAANLQASLASTLKSLLPPAGHWQLTADQEKTISDLIQKHYGVSTVPELDGNRLNHDYGRMGAEQHLPRYPGDSVYHHEQFLDKGITPGLGAWGYFAHSKDKLTPELEMTERYYVAVQTLYLPNWNQRLVYLRDWYKYRRVFVINPANGKAIVAAIADAGPADWTGKHFGGSPELMAYLGINYGRQNHPVLLFFLDDPKKEIPLGPIEYNWQERRKILANKS